MYLRKSRADIEAEARGEGETLKKHERLLYKLAKDLAILITEEPFREIVSGESIYHRPEMLRMMALMEERRPKGVLVVDMDRLGRGDMQEQGLILGTFRRLGVKIITPRKIYDLNDEFDEEYSEFEAFMARKELKIITRRLQRGRVMSVEAGNYIATRPPYGYEIMELPDGRTLKPHPEQAEVVRQIFRWYTHPDTKEQMGSSKIATKLNEMKIPSYTGRQWTPPTVLTILKNAVYVGRIQWKKKEQKKSRTPGKRRDTRMRDPSEWIDVPGKHEPLIDERTFQAAQERLQGRYHAPYQLDENGQPRITTALAGIVKCAKCGKTMVYRPYTHQMPHLRCNTPGCTTRSTQYELVEHRVVESLEQWLSAYKVQWGKRKKEEPSQAIEFKRGALVTLERELSELEFQKGRLFDFLERGIYSEEVFLERSQTLAQRIQDTQEAITLARKQLEEEEQRLKARHNVIPLVENVVKSYFKTKDPVKRNALLKSVLNHVTYEKGKYQRGDDFTLELFPRI
ncbi:recombinase [Paenibacillus sp. 32O-W]|nr:recombinase [Paenibacillus sp. 32O-W]